MPTTEPRILQVRTQILKKNDVTARSLRDRYRSAGVFVVSLVSSPGSGKTTFLRETLRQALLARLKLHLVGQPDLRPREPGHDPTEVVGIEAEQRAAPVVRHWELPDEAGIAQDPHLAADGRSAAADLPRENRRPSRMHGDQLDDPSPGGVGEEGDTGSVQFGHGPMVARCACLALMPEETGSACVERSRWVCRSDARAARAHDLDWSAMICQ